MSCWWINKTTNNNHGKWLPVTTGPDILMHTLSTNDELYIFYYYPAATNCTGSVNSTVLVIMISSLSSSILPPSALPPHVWQVTPIFTIFPSLFHLRSSTTPCIFLSLRSCHYPLHSCYLSSLPTSFSTYMVFQAWCGLFLFFLTSIFILFPACLFPPQPHASD